MECTRCGVCQDYCLAARTTGTSITTILNGTSETGAWNCSNCWKCVESCPEGVDIYDVMMKKRREEETPARYRRSYERICDTGYSFPVEEINTIREMWGLRKIRLADPEKVRRLLADRDKSSGK